MNWHGNFSEKIGHILRFSAYIFIAFDLIVLSIFTFWFVAKFTWRFSEWLNHVLFAQSWF